MTQGLLLVISAPSGAGKSTVCGALAERCPGVVVSVSCTTRPPRGGEKNGRDYHFLSTEEFHRRLKAGEFIESAQVHGSLYGTLEKPVADALAKGRDVVLNIDTQGARSVKERRPDCVRLFLLPPSWEALEERLKKRAQDHPDVIAERLVNARGEIARMPEYDYVVVNDRLEDAVRDVAAVLRAEKRRLSRSVDELRRLKFLQ
jgi:guanylate kinase